MQPAICSTIRHLTGLSRWLARVRFECAHGILCVLAAGLVSANVARIKFLEGCFNQCNNIARAQRSQLTCRRKQLLAVHSPRITKFSFASETPLLSEQKCLLLVIIFFPPVFIYIGEIEDIRFRSVVARSLVSSTSYASTAPHLSNHRHRERGSRQKCNSYPEHSKQACQ